MADLIDTAGANRVLTMTLHAPQVHGFFRIPVDHLNALHVLARYFQGKDLADTVVPNLTTLSVAPLLGEAIRRIHHGESVSSLFTAPDWIVDTG